MKIKKIFSALFLLAIAVIAVNFYIKNIEDFYLISTISPDAVFIISVLIVIMILFYALQLKVLMDHYKLGLDFTECLGLSRMTSLVNSFLPLGGGVSFKAIYLKKMHALKYSSFIASIAITNIIKIMINTLLVIILLFLSAGKTNIILLAAVCSLFSGSLLFLAFGHKLDRFEFTQLSYLKSVIHEWGEIRHDRKTVTGLICVSLIIFVLSSMNNYFAFNAFSVHISAAASGTIAAFSTITSLFNLAPGNFGIREAIVIAVSNAQGVEINQGLHAAALGRIISLVWDFLIVPFFLRNFSGTKKIFHHTKDVKGP
ncbi:MAG TPA: flippase-like domain-containing protein [Desulfobacterales bacterium]|nr:flippase-like domain-containing protein [Desulfobacterales bacterium]